MKTFFEGFVILDPDSEPVMETFLECETVQECIDKFSEGQVIKNPELWNLLLLKGWMCCKIKMEIER